MSAEAPKPTHKIRRKPAPVFCPPASETAFELMPNGELAVPDVRGFAQPRQIERIHDIPLSRPLEE